MATLPATSARCNWLALSDGFLNLDRVSRVRFFEGSRGEVCHVCTDGETVHVLDDPNDIEAVRWQLDILTGADDADAVADDYDPNATLVLPHPLPFARA